MSALSRAWSWRAAQAIPVWRCRRKRSPATPRVAAAPVRAVAVSAAMLLGACGGRPPATVDSSADAPTTKSGAFSREQLIADTRELARILEDTHPDPYTNGGGRIAFHRRLHRVLNAIPAEGLDRDEYLRLIRPFIAGVGDAHTGLVDGYEVVRAAPGGVPLELAVVEESLVVVGIAQAGAGELLGAKLVSVEGLVLAELVERQRNLQGIDNQYHALRVLADRSLRYRPYMLDLIPEWTDPHRVRVELRRADGAAAQLVLDQPGTHARWTRPASKVELPKPDESAFAYTFMRSEAPGEEIAYVRFRHMGGYREHRELRHPVVSAITRPRSATETFREMTAEMMRRGTGTLMLDVRGNPGGNSLIVDILIYFLYGKDAVLRVAGVGTGENGAFRYSRLYFKERPGESLEKINAGRFVPLVEGDYDFAWSYVNGEPIAKRTGPAGEPPMVRFLRESPTFREEYDSGSHAGTYRPRQVVVLCDAGTGSAGFSVVVEFHKLGATLLGTPSGQAPNSYGSGAFWELTHTGIRGYVPTIAAAHFPDRPELARVLPVDVPLTYERFRSYGWDPNSEVLYALERVEKGLPAKPSVLDASR